MLRAHSHVNGFAVSRVLSFRAERAELIPIEYFGDFTPPRRLWANARSCRHDVLYGLFFGAAGRNIASANNAADSHFVAGAATCDRVTRASTGHRRVTSLDAFLGFLRRVSG